MALNEYYDNEENGMFGVKPKSTDVASQIRYFYVRWAIHTGAWLHYQIPNNTVRTLSHSYAQLKLVLLLAMVT